MHTDTVSHVQFQLSSFNTVSYTHLDVYKRQESQDPDKQSKLI